MLDAIAAFFCICKRYEGEIRYCIVASRASHKNIKGEVCTPLSRRLLILVTYFYNWMYSLWMDF